LVPEFFSANAYHSVESRLARIITSIAMLYDLDSPVEFARQIAEVLAPDGIWHFEQSYMPSMLRMNSYDTICHEHLEYYSLGVIEKLLDGADMQIADVVTNAINGGSFAVTATHRANKSVRPNRAVIDWLLQQEDRMGLGTPKPYREFEERVFRHRDDLIRLIRSLNGDGKSVLGYGASTKGNVTMQFCGFTVDDIPAIADVNPDKFGCVTPGTHIPIISETIARAMRPDYFLVLPWHFKDGILRRERDFLLQGGKLIFPFPEIEIV
jgi:C-methyltransferase C-terminal domain